MNKNLKIALIIAAVIAVIYFWKKKNSDSSEKSEFLGMFAKKGSQKWADRLASKYCRWIHELRIVVNAIAANGNVASAQLAVAKVRIEKELEGILLQLAPYGYEIDTPSCKAFLKGGMRGAIYKPGDRIGKDCLCKDKTTWAESCCAGWSPK